MKCCWLFFLKLFVSQAKTFSLQILHFLYVAFSVFFVCLLVFFHWLHFLIPFLGGGGGGLVFKSCLTLVTPMNVTCQAPLSIGFPRQEHWSGLPFPSPGDLPNPRTELGSSALQLVSCIAGGFFTNWVTREIHFSNVSNPWFMILDLYYFLSLISILWVLLLPMIWSITYKYANFPVVSCPQNSIFYH